MTEASIRANTDSDTVIHEVTPSDIGMVETGCTGFTNVRYAIPELCRTHGYPGAIYLDCDMIVLGDVSELWDYYQPYKWVCLEDGSTEVSVICGGVQMPPISELPRYNKMELAAKAPKTSNIPMDWNVEDRVSPDMKLLHFTNLDTQPWFYDHPCQEAVAIYERYRP